MVAAARLVCQCEVQLAFLYVGPCHLYVDGVAQLVFVVVSAAYEAVVALVAVVVVVIEVVHGHESLAVVLVDFAVDAIRLNAADVRLVDVAYLVGHEFHHLVFDGVALGVGSGLLHIARVLAQFLVMLLVGAAPALLVTGEQAVNHRVGVAADGTGEVGVVVEGQSVVPDVVHAVARLHHRPQRHRLDEVLLARALAGGHECVEASRDGALGARRLEFVAKLGDDLAQVFQFDGVG